MPLDEGDRNLLVRYSRAIMHIRDQIRARRLMPGLGAGVSMELGFPSWGELVEKVEGGDDFKTMSPTKGMSATTKTQALMQHLRGSIGGHFTSSAENEREFRCRWIQIIHDALYEKIPKSSRDLLNKHSYLKDFLPLIKDAPLTINYNFDDSIERMMACVYGDSQHEMQDKVYETVWEPSTQFRKSSGVIYHPNGFLPLSIIDGFSDHFVFSEGEFADQLIDVMGGHYSTLASHLTRYTGLFLGVSLSDPTLRHLLRQSAHLNPGHIHYWVHHCRNESEVPSSRWDTEAMVNFDVYGIVTIHLAPNEYVSLAKLLQCSDDEFQEALDDRGLEKKYVYYITGAVGAGKTSIIRKLKSIFTVPEWIDSRPSELQKPHTDLSEAERSAVDAWVSGQFRMKNFKTIRSPNYIIACDRAPLDPMAFVKDADRSARAKGHMAIIQRTGGEKLQPGQVILLTASPEELMARAKERLKGASIDYLQAQQALISAMMNYSGLAIIPTSSRSLNDAVRAVCRYIHLGEYVKMDMAASLSAMADAE
jgi:predicted ATPase